MTREPHAYHDTLQPSAPAGRAARRLGAAATALAALVAAFLLGGATGGPATTVADRAPEVDGEVDASTSAVAAAAPGAAAAARAGSRVKVCVNRRSFVVTPARAGRCGRGASKQALELRGRRGPRGATGATGATGAVGPAGPQGEPGTTAFGDDTQWANNGTANSDCYLGEIRLTAGRVATGVPAEGQLLPIASYNGLYSLLGTRYGGDGEVSFALPDLTDAAPDGTTYSICTTGTFPSAD